MAIKVNDSKSNNPQDMTPEQLVEWAIENSDIKDTQEKQVKKQQLKVLVDALKITGAAAVNAGIVQSLLRGLSNAPEALKGAGQKIQKTWTADQAFYSARDAEENADIAEERYNNNPNAKNTKKWLETQAYYKQEAENYLSVTGNPWKQNLTFAPEVLAYIKKQENKQVDQQVKVVEQAQETARENRRVMPVASTMAQQEAETRREDRRAVMASAPLNPTVEGTVASNISPNDPRVLQYTKNNLFTTQEAIAIVAAQQAQLDAANGGPGGGGTQSSYRIFDAQQTAGFANQIAQNLIGRELTQDELNNITKTLNVESKKSPTVSKTIGGSTVQSGGIDAEQLVKQELKFAPEYANYQKATTYFDAMMGALRGPAGGGI